MRTFCENEASPRGAGNTAEGSDPEIAYTIGGLGVSLPSTGKKRPDLAARNRGDGGPYEDGEWCRTRYEGGMTYREMAAEAGCSLRTIARWMKIHGIEVPTAAQKAAQRGTRRRRRAPSLCACGSRKTRTSMTCMNCRDYTGARHPSWRGDEIGITQAHIRVAKLRGRAIEHTCLHCGGPAAHWAYDHSDPNERQSPEDGPYSTDPDHYMPLCVRCHKRFDLDYLRQKRAVA